jgi:hypothetical protein
MHEQYPDQQSQQQPSLAQNVNAVVAIAQYMSVIGGVFVRWPGTWGKRHAGMHMAVSWIIMFLFGPLFFKQADPRPMLYLWIAATALLLLHRIAGAFRRLRVHSLYTGKSIFSLVTRNEKVAKGVLEPMAFGLVGCLAGQFSPPMGVYFILVAVGSFISAEWMTHMENARVQAAEDAWHDAQYMQGEMQKRMGQ